MSPTSSISDALIDSALQGSVIACGLAIKQWSISECIREFISVASAVFPPKSKSGYIFAVMRSVFTDCLYSNLPLQQVLKRIFRVHTPLYCATTPYSITKEDIKVAITATDLRSKTVIFKNYNQEVDSKPLAYYSSSPRQSEKIWHE